MSPRSQASGIFPWTSSAWAPDSDIFYRFFEQRDKFVEKIDGSLTNVMGMPMELFERLFTKI
jgi:hypothetical protein